MVGAVSQSITEETMPKSFIAACVVERWGPIEQRVEQRLATGVGGTGPVLAGIELAL